MSYRILIAEDNVALATVTKFNFELNGFEVEVAPDGKTALQILEKDDGFDIIITDEQMPGLTGMELCRLLRSLPAYGQVPVILVTAKCLEIEQQSVRDELGIRAMFAKPFSPSQLIAYVQEELAAIG